MKTPRIIFVGENDWAQCCHRVAGGLNAYYGELVARVIVAYPHAYGYPQDVCVQDDGFFPALELMRKHFELDAPGEERRPCWLFSTGDGSQTGDKSFTSWFLSHCHHRGVQYGTFHIGSAYRANAGEFDKLDAAMGAEMRFVSADSMRLVNSMLAIRSYPYHYVNVVEERPLLTINERPVVVHSPSNPGMKGTTEIEEVVESLRNEGLDFEFRLITGVSHKECVKLRRGGDIFIGQLNTDVGGHGYSCVEAAAQGMVPIASLNHTDPVHWTRVGLPVPPVIGANNADELKVIVRDLVTDVVKLQAARAEACDWAHSGAASLKEAGKYYARLIERHTIRRFHHAQDQNQTPA